MNIIIPKSKEVEQFLVDVRDGCTGRQEKEFKDLTDKVMYLPKTIFSKDDTIPTFEQIKTELRAKNVSQISKYLKDLLKKLRAIDFLYKVKFDYSHIENFVKAYKNSQLKNSIRVYALQSERTINSDLFESLSDLNQDMTVSVKKVPEELSIDKSVMEIGNLKTHPVLVNVLELTL